MITLINKSAKFFTPANLFAALLFSSLVWSVEIADARVSELDTDNGPGEIIVVDAELGQVLKEFGHRTGLKVHVASNVRGRVQGKALSGVPEQFFTDMSSTYGLSYYKNGDAVYFSNASDDITHIVSTNGMTVSKLEEVLADIKIHAASDSLAEVMNRSDLAIIRGPLKYVAMVETIIKSHTDTSSSCDELGSCSRKTARAHSTISLIRAGYKKFVTVR